MALSMLVGIFVLAFGLTNALNETFLNDIRVRVKNVIDADDRDRRLIAGLVRLVFHDCVGNRCDGCINLKLEDNRGLEVYIPLVEPLYQQILQQGVKLSRADFWFIAATEAVYYAAKNADRGCRRCPQGPTPAIRFSLGREDCSTSPYTSEEVELPSPFWGTEKVLHYFNRTFGFDARETTAILGAHTLGQASRRNSGFVHAWDAKRSHLNNEFFKHLMNKDVGWRQIVAGTPRNPKYQWESRPDVLPLTMMLNSDMALIKDIGNVTHNGKVSCTYDTCPDAQSDTLKWATAFGQDNNMFLTEFSKAYQKMTSHGYTNLVEVSQSNADFIG